MYNDKSKLVYKEFLFIEERKFSKFCYETYDRSNQKMGDLNANFMSTSFSLSDLNSYSN